MLNAVMQRMVEESLVEKEVYEAMLELRANIERSISGNGSAEYETPATASPELPDLPVGNPDALRAMGVPVRDARVQQQVPPSVPKPSASGTAADGVPTDVLAAADPARDPKQRVAPYVKPTEPVSDSNPFPQLGPKGFPLG